MKRVFRIVLGLALIGYAVYSGNVWFYLGVVPLFFGIINWCPMEKLFGGCKDSSCCTSGLCEAPKVETPSSQCCGEVKAWSDKPKESCCGSEQKESKTDSCCAESKGESCCTDDGSVKIEVLGTGCAKCKTLEAAAKDAVSKVDGKYCIEKVEDVQKIMTYGVMSTPALVIGGKVVSSGKLLSSDEIVELLKVH